MPFRRKSAKVEAVKINGPIDLETAPRWLLVAMVNGHVARGAAPPARLVVKGLSAFDNDWIVKEGSIYSVVPNSDFTRDYEENP